ncbi:MAG: MBL fold metallo-hydrolase [Candidatus Yanofskyibacterium parasiticum]|jgi:beta-lactamase superfamily II metal-dependent hydrolase|nr:MAG: MBL fold metallo-hydrolase [Candidatus Yanofskybacteria bacterium]
MGYEIDYLPVGDGEKGGDAIILRYGNLFGQRAEQNIVVIDGGTKESGVQIVEHIKKFYNTDYVDTVICTHVHSDHASGLTEVLSNLKVNQLLMHLPWEHSGDIKKMFTNGKLTIRGLKERTEKSLTAIKDLETLASEKNVPIIEPFQGLSIHNDGNLLVLSPSEQYYAELLANFDIMPEIKSEFIIYEKIKGFGKAVIKWMAETIDLLTETLGDDGETNCENNGSTIILFSVDNQKILFTGDAGIPAIQKSIDYANFLGIDLNNVDFLDMPHHGSKRNIGKTLLSQLKPTIAFISAPKDGDPKHPSRKVVNALKRRGTKVVATKGKQIHHSKDAPDRPGWVPAQEEPFYDQVED